MNNRVRRIIRKIEVGERHSLSHSISHHRHGVEGALALLDIPRLQQLGERQILAVHTNVATGLNKKIVVLDGDEITKLSPQERVRRGMGFVPQTSNIFTSMTVRENLEMGAYLRDDDFSDTMAQIFDLFPILKEKSRQIAGELSGGQRQQVAVARALMMQPRVLMLDEPTAGVSPIVMDELFDRIIEIRDSGIAVLLVEQNAAQALAIADRGYVLVNGENRFSDSGQALLEDAEVRRSFLGG